MIKSNHLRLFLLVFAVLFATNSVLFSQVIANTTASEDTVLVRYGNTTITTRELRDKINSLPQIERHRFKTVEGQKNLLDMMLTERIVFKRAMELGIDQREEVINAFRLGTRSIVNRIYFEELFAQEYSLDLGQLERHFRENRALYSTPARVTIQHLQVDRDDLPSVQEALSRGTDVTQFIETDFSQLIRNYTTNPFSSLHNGFIRGIRLDGSIPGIGVDLLLENYIANAIVDADIIHGPFETNTGIHFFKKLEHVPTVYQTFSEVRDEIETRLRAEGEREFYTSLIQRLRTRYNVVVLGDIVEGMRYFVIPPSIADTELLWGNNPEISMTLGEFGRVMGNIISPRALEEEDRIAIRRFLTQEVESRILNVAALEANILENHKDRDDIQQILLFAVLNGFMLAEVHERIEVTHEEIVQLYETYTEYNTIPAFRNIRQFVAPDERTARRHHRNIRRMLRRNQEHDIAVLTRQESLAGAADGVILNIHRDGIIPGLGTDIVYNEKVFTANVGVLSDMFRNVNDQVVFFYVIREEPERVRPLSHIADVIASRIHREKARELFAQTKEDLFTEHGVVKYLDRLTNMATPEALFLLAEEALFRQDISEAMLFLDQIIYIFADSKHEHNALFMKAFITYDKLEDRGRAIKLFEEFLSRNTIDELSESAEFILDALKANTPLEMIRME